MLEFRTVVLAAILAITSGAVTSAQRSTIQSTSALRSILWVWFSSDG